MDIKEMWILESIDFVKIKECDKYTLSRKVA